MLVFDYADLWDIQRRVIGGNSHLSLVTRVYGSFDTANIPRPTIIMCGTVRVFFDNRTEDSRAMICTFFSTVIYGFACQVSQWYFFNW